MSTHRFIALEVIFAIVIGIHRLQATFNAQGGLMRELPFMRPVVLVAMILALFAPLAAASQTGNASAGGQAASGGGSAASSGQSPASGASAGASYRVEEDMLAYQAADVVAAEIANNVKNQRLILYDQPTFINLQFYEAYAAEIATLESAYERITTSHASYGALDFPGSATAAQTIIGTLAAMRSTTDIGSQQTSSQIDAIIALLAKHLVNPSAVVVPKLLLATPFDLKITGAASNSDCNNINKSVPDQLACLLTVRAAAASQGNNEEFQNVDKLFQSFFGTLLGSSVASSLLSPSAGGAGGAGAQTGTGNLPQSAQSNNAPVTSVPLLSSVILGSRLESQLLTPACAAGTVSTKLLVLEATAAGGAYRVRHNFWVELFWTTPDPSFNGGAVITYILIDPCTSQIVQSNTLRYIYDYGKFDGAKKVKSRANFVPTYEPQ